MYMCVVNPTCSHTFNEFQHSITPTETVYADLTQCVLSADRELFLA